MNDERCTISIVFDQIQANSKFVSSHFLDMLFLCEITVTFVIISDIVFAICVIPSSVISYCNEILIQTMNKDYMARHIDNISAVS